MAPQEINGDKNGLDVVLTPVSTRKLYTPQAARNIFQHKPGRNSQVSRSGCFPADPNGYRHNHVIKDS